MAHYIPKVPKPQIQFTIQVHGKPVSGYFIRTSKTTFLVCSPPEPPVQLDYTKGEWHLVRHSTEFKEALVKWIFDFYRNQA